DLATRLGANAGRFNGRGKRPSPGAQPWLRHARELAFAAPHCSGMARPFARLQVPLATPPMEARLVAELPDEAGWQFEPKWDGFRCLAFRDRGAVELMSKSGKPLGRYFPEVAALLGGL